jgi:hypothetical protein
VIALAYSDESWAECKKKCRLNTEDIALAKKLGLNPRSLIKNIPSKSQPWKAPVKEWLRGSQAQQKIRTERPTQGQRTRKLNIHPISQCRKSMLIRRFSGIF